MYAPATRGLTMATLTDGSANATAGAAQFSNILNGYAARPDWKVAGVDYHVGTPSGTALKDPSTISMAGVSVNKSTHTVTVSSSNVTLNGYDFGLSGGWQVNVIDGASNVTVQNSSFKVGANNLVPIQAIYGGSINVLNNTFDGGASAGSSATSMVFTGTGGANIEYNRFTNFPNDGINITNDGNFVVHYNVFDTMGAGDYHTDAIQTFFSSVSSLSIQYNTMYQPPSMANGGMNAFVRIGDQRGGVVHDPVAAYNTIVMASTNAETANVFQWDSDGAGTLLNPVIHHNFIDPKGVMYGVVSPSLQNSGVVNASTYDNVNMATGKPLLVGPYNNYTTGVPANAPKAPVITAESAVGTSQAKLTGTAAAGTTVEIFDNDHLLGTAQVGTGGVWTFTTQMLTVGSHGLAARATDSLSNSSAVSNVWSVSVTSSGVTDGGSAGGGTPSAPGVPSIASFSNDTGVAGDGITADKTIQLKGTAVAGSIVKVFDGTSLIGQTTAAAGGTWDYTTATLSDAVHTFKATATNASGQSSAASAALTLKVDSIAPAAPIIATGSFGNATNAVLSGTAEANSTVKIYDGTTLVVTGVAGANGSWTVATSDLTQGTHSFKATATDAAGNVSAFSQQVTATGGVPASSSLVPAFLSISTDTGVAGDRVTSDNTLTLSGTAAANGTVKVFDGSKLVGQAKVDGSGHWTIVTATLSDGLHKFTATGTDAAGHASAASAALSVTIDTHASTPTLSAVSDSGVAIGATTTLDHFVFKGTAEAGSKVSVFDGAKQIGTVVASSTGGWAYDTGHLDNGSHSFSAKATDIAGNASASSAAKAITVNAAVATLDFTDISVNSRGGVTIKGTADANSMIKLYDDGKALGTVKADATGAWTFDTSYLRYKAHSFTADEIDSSGHVIASTSGAAILGSRGADRLTSTAGNDLFVGNGHPDTFIFAANFGHDVIKDFAASGRWHDSISFSKSVFSDFASVLNHATQVGQDVVIAHGNDSLTLKNTKIGGLNAYDFHFA